MRLTSPAGLAILERGNTRLKHGVESSMFLAFDAVAGFFGVSTLRSESTDAVSRSGEFYGIDLAQTVGIFLRKGDFLAAPEIL